MAIENKRSPLLKKTITLLIKESVTHEKKYDNNKMIIYKRIPPINIMNTKNRWLCDNHEVYQFFFLLIFLITLR